jgi:O-methyltransferase
MALETPTEVPKREIHAAGPRPQLEALRVSYLELLKLCLCDLTGVATRTVTWTENRRLFSRELTGDQIEWRAGGGDWPLNALTMVGLTRLDDLQACVECVVSEGVDGDLIEVGAWRGGASILMRATLDTLGADDRTVWVADSFQGFPLPEAEGDPEDRKLDLRLNAYDYLAAPLEDVTEHFARFGCAQGVNFVPGFFEETMADLRGRGWSIVRLDGDSYKSTWLTLEALYPGLAVGGYLIIDEYHQPYLPMCRRAVDDFRREHDITEPIEQIDLNGARWRRVTESPISRAPARAAPRNPSRAGTTRVAPRREAARIPTDRELQLEDEVAELQARIRTVEAELEELRSSPLAGPLDYPQRRTKPDS